MHREVFDEGGLFGGRDLKIFLVVGHILLEIFLLVNHFFDATHTSNKIFLKYRQIFVNEWLHFLSQCESVVEEKSEREETREER